MAQQILFCIAVPEAVVSLAQLIQLCKELIVLAQLFKVRNSGEGHADLIVDELLAAGNVGQVQGSLGYAVQTANMGYHCGRIQQACVHHLDSLAHIAGVASVGAYHMGAVVMNIVEVHGGGKCGIAGAGEEVQAAVIAQNSIRLLHKSPYGSKADYIIIAGAAGELSKSRNGIFHLAGVEVYQLYAHLAGMLRGEDALGTVNALLIYVSNYQQAGLDGIMQRIVYCTKTHGAYACQQRHLAALNYTHLMVIAAGYGMVHCVIGAYDAAHGLSKGAIKVYVGIVGQRWSIAHLYQAMLNGESHVKDISFLTTLAGYIHWRLTGKKAIGVNEASGMFPVDTSSCDYDKRMLGLFDKLAADLGMEWKVGQLLPEIIPAGRTAGTLTEEGARLLDPSGTLQAGIPLCAPEGDAGTGMIATNSIAPGTGNLSAGTSIFVTITMDQALSRLHPEIDVLANPAGHPAAMVHCINGTPEIDAWINLFGDVTASLGQPADKNKLYEAFYTAALKGSEDCGGLTAFNFLAGEHIIDLPEGRPMLIRRPDSEFSFANLARVILFSTLGSVRIGMNILTQQEGVLLKELLGHGGLYKTTDAGQRITAAALNVPVRIRSGASEGGAWGIALLAAYMQDNNGESLVDYLNGGVFAADQSTLAKPDAQLAASFNSYMERYGAGLNAQRAAIEHL